MQNTLLQVEQKRVEQRALEKVMRVKRISADINRANYDTIQEHERLRKLDQICRVKENQFTNRSKSIVAPNATKQALPITTDKRRSNSILSPNQTL